MSYFYGMFYVPLYCCVVNVVVFILCMFDFNVDGYLALQSGGHGKQDLRLLPFRCSRKGEDPP